jgi:hypothetical protein
MSKYVRVKSSHLSLGQVKLAAGDVLPAADFGEGTAAHLVERGRLEWVTEADLQAIEAAAAKPGRRTKPEGE